VLVPQVVIAVHPHNYHFSKKVHNLYKVTYNKLCDCVRVTTLPGKSWKVMEFSKTIFEAWKVMENSQGHGKSWKMMMMSGNFVVKVH